jgi:sorting nexin-9/18/33
MYAVVIHALQSDDEVASRCETVLNVAAAEMDVYHTQKLEDFRKLAEDYLDEEIAVHEKVLSIFAVIHQKSHSHSSS